MKLPALSFLFSAFVLSGCALTSKAEPMTVTLYNPIQTKPRLTAAEAGTFDEARPAVELGRIGSGFHLREKIMHRDSAHELGTYDDRRWTERPESYVRRELVRTLFEERGFRRVLAGEAPILDVDVVSFEEVRLPNLHAARIELHVVLHNAHDVFLEETIVVEKPANTGVDGFVVAMAGALDEATAEVARKIEKAQPRTKPKADPQGREPAPAH